MWWENHSWLGQMVWAAGVGAMLAAKFEWPPWAGFVVLCAGVGIGIINHVYFKPTSN